MSIKTQDSSTDPCPDFSSRKYMISKANKMTGQTMNKYYGESSSQNKPAITVLRILPDGSVLDSNMAINVKGMKPQNIGEILQGEDLEILMQDIENALKNKTIFSKKFSEKSFDHPANEKTMHFVPINGNEVLAIVESFSAEVKESEKIDKNLNAMIQLLEFLPGETLIANANHRLLNLSQKKKHQKFSYDENNQIGAFIGCSHFLEEKGDCGVAPACNKCAIKAAIQTVASKGTDIHKQSIRLPLRINNGLQFKDFLLSISQALVDGEKYFVVYLEDSDNQKVKIKELQDSNELLWNVLDSLPFSVYWKNLNSTFLGGNQGFYEENNFKSQDQIFGQREHQIYSIDTAREHQKQDEIVLKIEKPLWNCESNWANSRSRKNNFKSKLKDRSGRKIGLVGASIDLAQHNWFQFHANNGSPDQNVSFSDIDDLGVFDWLLKIDMLKGNPQFQTITGMQNRSVFLEDLLVNVNDEEVGKKLSGIKQKIENEGEYRFLHTLKYVHPVDKTIRWFDISGQKIFKDLYGNPIKVTCLLRDVTEKKQDELAQEHSKIFHAAFLDSTKDAIWSIDKDYKITLLNQSFKANYLMAFGVDLEIGSCCLEALDESMKRKWTKRYKKALRGSAFKVVDQLDYEGLHQTAETILSPIRMEDQIVGVSCFSRDISKS